jgi:putative redox protein
MVEMQIAYKGQLRCEARHVDSGSTLLTDAPKDNMGQGESFSPTDLVGVALGTCMLTTMGIVAQRMQLDLGHATVVVTKEMIVDPGRRIQRLTVTLNIPLKLNDEQRQKLKNAAITCPVHKALLPAIEMPLTFNWA